ncbi:MAG: PQQ-binding-like beta-propeller repeat protein [Verrucomicrobia subdivision 3 bacterium]|nr:PQQ-binding-like beta-propeller repeat protein [Limisphaerales bacterium]
MKKGAVVLLLSAGAIQSALAAEDGLLHRWRFEQAKDGAIPAVVGAPARYGGSANLEKQGGLGRLRLMGTDSRAWVTDDFNSVKVPQKSITVEAWVSPAAPMAWGCIAGIIQDNGDYERGWLLGYRERKFVFTLSSEGNQKLAYTRGKTDFQDNRWYHVVGTYDSETKATRLYVNGKLEVSETRHSGAISYPPKATFELGNYKDDNEVYRGKISLHEISIYEKALDAANIEKRFNARKNEFPLPPQPLEFVSSPQLRWQNRSTLRMDWKTAGAMPATIRWKRADGTGERLIELSAAKHVSTLITNLPSDGDYRYRIIAKGKGNAEFASEWYKFDTSFFYRLPDRPKRPSPFANDAPMRRVQSAAKRILSETSIRQGYALVLGSAGGRLAHELARQTDLQVIVVEPDAAKAQAARKALNVAGLYGIRASVHHGSVADLPYGPYFANLIVSGSLLFDGKLPGDNAEELWRVLRPAGGVAMLGHAAGELTAAQLKNWFKTGQEDCQITVDGNEVWATVKRGKLEGAGDWTHQYGSADNTTNSRDDLVRGEMGILWWGEPGPRPMPDRGGRNPAPLATNGRMFIQGDRVLFGVDAYNGTVLWTFFAPEMRRSNMPRDGSNMVATDNTVFVTIGGECIALDAQTGQRRTAVHAAKGRDWGWISASQKQLLSTTVKRDSSYTADSGEWYDAFRPGEVERVVSDSLVSHDAATGKQQWAYRGGAVMNSTITIADDTIYFVESRNPEVAKAATSRLMPAELNNQYLVAIDRKTGRKLWEKTVDFAKCENMLYLLHAKGTLVATGSDRKHMYYNHAFDVSSPALRFGTEKPEVPELWKNSYDAHKKAKDNGHGEHIQHPLVIGETFFGDSRAFHLHTGKSLPIQFPERRGCGNMAASSHSMFYRHYFHGIWDIEANKKSELQGIRSGCWLGIIPAQGLMLAPESSSGCSCTHSIQTSAAWVPRTVLKKKSN